MDRLPGLLAEWRAAGSCGLGWSLRIRDEVFESAMYRYRSNWNKLLFKMVMFFS